MKNLLQSLDRPIAFQRSFVRLTGSITAALFLSQAIYWTLRSSGGDGWFYKTQPDWENETGMTRREQDSARKILRELGVLCEEKRGMPARIWFRVDEEKLASCLAEYANQAWRKAPNTAGGKRQAFIGTETTAETTKPTPPTPPQAVGMDPECESEDADAGKANRDCDGRAGAPADPGNAVSRERPAGGPKLPARPDVPGADHAAAARHGAGQPVRRLRRRRARDGPDPTVGMYRGPTEPDEYTRQLQADVLRWDAERKQRMGVAG